MITKRDNLGRIVRLNKPVDMICPCGSEYETDEGRLAIGRGRYCSKKCFYKYRKVADGEKHHFWKIRPSYSGIHKWVQSKLGSPMLCRNCGFTSDNKYQIQWANISGDYKRDTSDWIRLCAKCHYGYDRNNKKVGFNYG